MNLEATNKLKPQTTYIIFFVKAFKPFLAENCLWILNPLSFLVMLLLFRFANFSLKLWGGLTFKGNKLHSKIVKHVLSLHYSNINYASFRYCCAVSKYEYLIFRIIIHVFIHESFTVLVNVSLFQRLFISKCTNNIYELSYIRRKSL